MSNPAPITIWMMEFSMNTKYIFIIPLEGAIEKSFAVQVPYI